jgi:hypothetical protein
VRVENGDDGGWKMEKSSGWQPQLLYMTLLRFRGGAAILDVRVHNRTCGVNQGTKAGEVRVRGRWRARRATSPHRWRRRRLGSGRSLGLEEACG